MRSLHKITKSQITKPFVSQNPTLSDSQLRSPGDSPKRMGIMVANRGLVTRGPLETPAASRSLIMAISLSGSGGGGAPRRTDLWVTAPGAGTPGTGGALGQGHGGGQGTGLGWPQAWGQEDRS